MGIRDDVDSGLRSVGRESTGRTEFRSVTARTDPFTLHARLTLLSDHVRAVESSFGALPAKLVL